MKLVQEGDICILVPITALVTEALCKSLLFMDIPNGMNGISTMCAVYTMSYYVATEKSVTLACVIEWVRLTLLGEISQAQNDTHCMRSLVCGL